MKRTPETMASLLTEQRNPRSEHIDRMSTREILQIIHEEDKIAVQAVEQALPQIEQAVEFIVAAFQNGGRLFYFGAGTSGRLGVLDASECPPTFGVDPTMVQGVIAGGWDALRRAVERAEDNPGDGAKAVIEHNIGENDVAVGIAASGLTPFVHGALDEAKQRGAKTAFVTCHSNPDHMPNVDVVIPLLVGPEVVTGSTRMKAGTVTKLALNMLTTTAMIRIGKVYRNLMVDLTATNFKLEDRSRRIISMLTDLSYDEAEALIKQANGRLKTALVMHYLGISREEAEQQITNRNGRIQDVISTNQ
ncbi:MAG: N-acetylmuramic acid 6-phosphate etherase [Candidatus Hinthialibacter antarcticus]|nr:N-acetylmuramic acid 6-phosphate etherase [Candidatus Hinthialibacter antarcticus]